MKLRFLLGFFTTCCAISCATDDEDIRSPQQNVAGNFRIIGTNLDGVFEFSFNGTTNTNETNNLTEEVGVLPNFLTLRQRDDLLSFYSFSGGSFSLAQKDLANGSASNFDDFYENTSSRSIVWGTNSPTNVFLGYFPITDTESRDIALLDIQLSNLEGLDTVIATDVDAFFQPLLFEQHLFITFRDNDGNYRLSSYNTITKTIDGTLNFGATPIGIFIDSEDNLALVNNEAERTLELYDSNTLSLIGSTSIANSRVSAGPGPLDDVVLVQDQLYYRVPIPQPSNFSVLPGIYNLSTQENTTLDLSSAVNSIQSELGQNISLQDVLFSESQQVFLVSYRTVSQDIQGGVMQISTDGELLENTMFPFLPVFIVYD